MRICGVVVACLLVASVARADEPDLGDKVGALVDTGEAWNLDVPKLVTLLGTPATATADQIEWASMQGERCAYTIIKADEDGYLKKWSVTTSDDKGEHWPICKKLLGKKAKLPAKLRAPKQLDADAQATAIFSLWAAGNYSEVFDSMGPALQETVGSPDVFARFAKLFDERAGKVVKVGSPFEHGFSHFGWTVTAPLVYEKGTLRLALSFELYKGKVVLDNFNLGLPEELQVKPDPKDAAVAARTDLDLLLAGKTATFYDHVEWELAKNMPRATLEPKLAEVLKKIGKVKSIKLTQQSKCDDNQCFTFELTSANGKETATFELSFNIAEWQVSEFNLAPPQ